MEIILEARIDDAAEFYMLQDMVETLPHMKRRLKDMEKSLAVKKLAIRQDGTICLRIWRLLFCAITLPLDDRLLEIAERRIVCQSANIKFLRHEILKLEKTKRRMNNYVPGGEKFILLPGH